MTGILSADDIDLIIGSGRSPEMLSEQFGVTVRSIHEIQSGRVPRVSVIDRPAAEIDVICAQARSSADRERRERQRTLRETLARQSR